MIFNIHPCFIITFDDLFRKTKNNPYTKKVYDQTDLFAELEEQHTNETASPYTAQFRYFIATPRMRNYTSRVLLLVGTVKNK